MRPIVIPNHELIQTINQNLIIEEIIKLSQKIRDDIVDQVKTDRY